MKKIFFSFAVPLVVLSLAVVVLFTTNVSSANAETLSVTKLGNGSGTVSGGGINCGSTCSITVSATTVTKLTATPAAGSVFGGWVTVPYKTCNNVIFGSQNLPTCTITGSLTKLEAYFYSPSTWPKAFTTGQFVYSIPLKIDVHQKIPTPFNFLNYDVLGYQIFIRGTIKEGPALYFQNPSSPIAYWNVNFDTGADGWVSESELKGALVDNFVVTRIGLGTVTGGGINCGSTCSMKVNVGTSITLTATPNPNYIFVGWSEGCINTSSTCTVNANNQTIVKAIFHERIPNDYRFHGGLQMGDRVSLRRPNGYGEIAFYLEPQVTEYGTTMINDRSVSHSGIIIGGPKTDRDHFEYYWNVDFDTGADGWVKERNLGLALNVNDLVSSLGSVGVYVIPSTSATLVSGSPNPQPNAVLGRIETKAGYSSPHYSNNNKFWYVNFDSGPDGWVNDASISKYNLTPTITSFSASPRTITQGGQVWLSWDSTNTSSCTASKVPETGGNWSGLKLTSGSVYDTPSATTTYSLSCLGKNGSTISATPMEVVVTTSPPPPSTSTPTINVFQPSKYTINKGESVIITWSSTNTTSCTGTGGAFDGAKNPGSNNTTTISPTQTTIYGLTCINSAGQSVTATPIKILVKDVVVTPPAPLPTVTLIASQYTINQGESTTLRWDVTNATSCTGTGGTFADVPAKSASTGKHTETVSPAQTTIYGISCKNSAGQSVTATPAKILVLVAPTATFSVAQGYQYSINPGESAKLEWSSTNTTSCTGSSRDGTGTTSTPNWTGTIAISGTVSVSPTTNTIYVFSCTGTDGSTVLPTPASQIKIAVRQPVSFDNGKVLSAASLLSLIQTPLTWVVILLIILVLVYLVKRRK